MGTTISSVPEWRTFGTRRHVAKRRSYSSESSASFCSNSWSGSEPYSPGNDLRHARRNGRARAAQRCRHRVDERLGFAPSGAGEHASRGPGKGRATGLHEPLPSHVRGEVQERPGRRLAFEHAQQHRQSRGPAGTALTRRLPDLPRPARASGVQRFGPRPSAGRLGRSKSIRLPGSTAAAAEAAGGGADGPSATGSERSRSRSMSRSTSPGTSTS